MRDQWRLVLWFVRLRRFAMTGQHHSELTKIEQLTSPIRNVKDPVMAARNAKLEVKEEKKEDSEPKEDPLSEESKLFDEDIKDDLINELDEIDRKSNLAKAEFFDGI